MQANQIHSTYMRHEASKGQLLGHHSSQDAYASSAKLDNPIYGFIAKHARDIGCFAIQAQARERG